MHFSGTAMADADVHTIAGATFTLTVGQSSVWPGNWESFLLGSAFPDPPASASQTLRSQVWATRLHFWFKFLNTCVHGYCFCIVFVSLFLVVEIVLATFLAVQQQIP